MNKVTWGFAASSDEVIAGSGHDKVCLEICPRWDESVCSRLGAKVGVILSGREAMTPHGNGRPVR